MEGIREGLAGAEGVRIEEMEENINDALFAERAVGVLRGMVGMERMGLEPIRENGS